MGKLLAFFRFLRRHQNLAAVLAAWAALVVIALASGYWLFFRAAYVLGGLIPLSYLWARANLWGLEVNSEPFPDRLQVGQRAEARLSVRNRSWYPKLWLEMDAPSDMPGAQAKVVLTLPVSGYRSWRLSLPCLRRGVFNIGPLTVTSGDPFGLFRVSRRFGQRQRLLVYPLPVELPYFWAPPAHLPGEGRQRRRTHYVTPNAASVRDYEPGDSFSRIHWRSTARLSRLMVKTFELDPSSDIWVLLDLHGPVQVGEGEESSEEYGVRIACSLAYHFLSANRSLGLLAYGRRLDLLEPGRGLPQYTRILEALALAGAEGEAPLARVVEEESKRFGRHTTLVVITPSADESWVLSLQSLLQRGARVAVVLLEPSSFGAPRPGGALLAYSTLVASDILTYLVRRGDDLSLALGPLGAASEPYATYAHLPAGRQAWESR